MVPAFLEAHDGIRSLFIELIHVMGGSYFDELIE
jgi:hypothetical protein